MASHRILYVGYDLALLAALQGALTDCHIVRSPDAGARSLIESRIDYSLLLFDHQWRGLADYARSLQHREHTPVITLPAGEAETEQILTTVICSLGRLGRRP
jgi:hypothetical protein